MKIRTKTIIILSCALGAVLPFALGACAGAKTREDTLDSLAKQGNSVIVHYEKNGGVFNSKKNADIFDAFSMEDVEDGGVPLLEPGDPDRGSNNSVTSTVTRSGYTLIGWYRHIEPRVNEDGNPLDDEGNICYIPRVVTEDGVAVRDEEGNPCFEYVSDAGKPQAYTYIGRWDFGKDRVRAEDLEPEEYRKGKTVMAFRLYAAWAPNFTYDFYREEGGEWVKYASVIKPAASDFIAAPHWEDTAGSLNYEAVPRYAIAADEKNGISAQSFTLTGLYADASKTQPYFEEGTTACEAKIPHHGTTDLESGTATGTCVKLYTTWKEGNWFRISTAAQLAANAAPDGCYEILADLNCSEISWKFSGYIFTGTFKGNGHTLFNITSRQTDAEISVPHGGLFGTFSAQAHLEDITFENVTYSIEAGARPKRFVEEQVTFGLFAGAVADGVTDANIDGVKLTGSIAIGGRNLVWTSGAKAGEVITAFTVGTVAGNLFGEELKKFCGFGLEAEIEAYAAVHSYSQDKYGNSIYGTTLAVQSVGDETSGDYGRVTVTVLDEPIPAEQ